MWPLSSDFPRAIARHTERLRQLFRERADKHEAHRLAAPLLQEMASDREFLQTAFEHYLRRPGVLNTRHFPSVGIDVDTNPYYGLVLNAFLPAPTFELDVTYNAIHHHGPMLLTTVAAFGPGYEHWRFTPPELVDPERDLFTTRLIDRGRHTVGNVSFVDTRILHAVMYPASLSLTVALWSSKNRVGWRDHVKRLPFFRGREKQLRDLAARLGLARALDLKVVHYYDFYPTAEGLVGMRERVQFERGPNRDFLFSLFHILQTMGFQDVGRVIEAQVDAGEPVENPALIAELLDEMRRDRPIPFRYTEGLHFGIRHMNFRAREIEMVLGACPVSA